MLLEHAGFREEGEDSAAAMENAYKWILIWGEVPFSACLFTVALINRNPHPGNTYRWPVFPHLSAQLLMIAGLARVACRNTVESYNMLIWFAGFAGTILATLLFILWPLLALPAKVFSKGYFTFCEFLVSLVLSCDQHFHPT